MPSKGRARLLEKLVKYSTVGAVGSVAHYALLIALVQGFAANVLLATSVGALAGALVNYFMNYTWTFASAKRHSETMTKFFVIATVGFVLNGLLMMALAGHLHLHYLLAQVLTTGVVLLWGFLANHYWTFSEARPKA